MNVTLCLRYHYALALLLAVTACSSPPPLSDHFYRLSPPTPILTIAPLAKPLLPGNLEVKRFLAEGVTGSQSLLYIQEGPAPEIAEYHYHFWASPPTQMLQEWLTQILRQSQIARQVVSPEHRVRADHELMGRLVRFERIPAVNRVAITLELSLRDRSGRDLLFLKQYALEIEEKGEGIPGAVAAFGAGVAQIYEMFLKDIQESLRKKK